MKKFNNKGFVLVETVIVSVFVLTIFVLVYQNSIPMIDEYKHRTNYDDIDSVYDVGLVRNLVLGDINYFKFQQIVNENGYKEIVCNDLEKKEACEVLLDNIGVTKGDTVYGHIYLTKWEDTSKLTTNKDLSTGFLDYIIYLKQQNQDPLTEYRLLMSRVTTYEEEYEDSETYSTKEKEVYHYVNIGM